MHVVECALSRFYCISVSLSRSDRTSTDWEEAVEEDDTGTSGRQKPRRARPAYRRAACQMVVVVVVAGRQCTLIHNIPNQCVFDHGVRWKPSASIHLLVDPDSFPSNSFLVTVYDLLLIIVVIIGILPRIYKLPITAHLLHCMEEM
jgi:hypothetical protein